MENPEDWQKMHDKSYFLPEPTTSITVKNGFILPIIGEVHEYRGGVCDADGSFVAGHQMGAARSDGWYNLNQAYPFDRNAPRMDKTVVYGGVLNSHFGHFIVECLARMWWYLENSDCGYKFVFISPDKNIHRSPLIEYFLLLGLEQKDMIFLRKPMGFSSIIVPDQASYIFGGFRDKAMAVYNVIRDKASPSKYEKIYFTRTRLVGKSTMGEEYFENYYRSLGYEIIAPEQLSIQEQINVAVGAEKIVCVNGSAHHHILFCQDGIDITLLTRNFSFLQPQFFWINQAKNARFTCVDASANFLPICSVYLCCLLMPTMYWKQYVQDLTDAVAPNANQINETVLEYIKLWATMFAAATPSQAAAVEKLSLPDIANRIQQYKYLFDNAPDVVTQEQIRVAYFDQELSTTLKKAFLQSKWGAFGRRKFGFLRGTKLHRWLRS